MTNGINQPTWEIINSINGEIQENEKTQKRGQAQIAETNHTQGKQKIAKDIILPFAGNDQVKNLATGKGAEGKPNLPLPKTTFAGLKADDHPDKAGAPIGDPDDANGGKGKTLGLIAIIGAVMALQAKSNSNFWSTLWKQASESMMIEVKMAPVMGEAIKTAYMDQSQATKAQADMAKQDGAISLCMFGGAMLFGLGSEFFGSSEAELGEDANVEDETKNVEDSNSSVNEEEEEIEEGTLGSNQEEEAAEQTENDINRSLNREETSWKNRLKRTGKFIKDVGGRTQSKLSNGLGKGMQYAMGADMLSRGISGFVDAKYKSKQAEKEGEEGQAQALSKETEQYAQFYGQAFQRSDTLTQGTQQNLDYAMNILKSAADTITQTVTSMFRG